ncbi:MAG: M23 family metallopeptidase [Actinomycetaceae bacterium]|nr:M23 family metallopeptidase [Actinomycetaceae bacterium]
MRAKKMLAAFAILPILVGVMLPANASDPVKGKEEATRKQARANAALEGINKELAGVFRKKAELDAKVPVARKKVEDARARAGAAERDHQKVVNDLAVARAEAEKIAQKIAEDSAKADVVRKQIGALAAKTYRDGGTDSTLSLALTSATTEDFTKAASAANQASQNGTLTIQKLRSQIAKSKNQEDRQKALADQIKVKEQAAKSLADKAKAAKDAEEKELASLDALQAQSAKAAADLNQRKGQAQKELEAAQAEITKFQQQIQQIDAQNRSGGVVSARPAPSGGIFIRPYNGPLYVTSPYGYRVHPVVGTRILHAGVDLGAGCGVPQFATADGVVSEAGWFDTGGNGVFINHGMIGGNSYVTGHLHLSRIDVSVGQHVRQGQQIGLTGATGRVTGCHAHYEIHRNGVTIDPMTMLR